ncbi:MAG TPA: GPW/gp25 family protein [Polyangia bacterium]|nr:GPW/gp25 family protein [Polyangia bacterium]
MSINWSPTTAQEVVQNVETLLATEPGTVPFARSLGTPQDVVDQPESIAGAQLQAAVIKAVRTYEPRVAVKAVALTATADGTLSATVTLGAP